MEDWRERTVESRLVELVVIVVVVALLYVSMSHGVWPAWQSVLNGQAGLLELLP